MIGGAVMTRLMLPLSGDLFEARAEIVVDNLLICAAVHESESGANSPSIKRCGTVSSDPCETSVIGATTSQSRPTMAAVIGALVTQRHNSTVLGDW